MSDFALITSLHDESHPLVASISDPAIQQEVDFSSRESRRKMLRRLMTGGALTGVSIAAVTVGQDYVALAGVGPTGPKGPTGPTGRIGQRGVTGARGVVGGEGPTGPTGMLGPSGSRGPQGPQGTKGTIGSAGPKGPAGSAGPAGPTGRLLGTTGVTRTCSVPALYRDWCHVACPTGTIPISGGFDSPDRKLLMTYRTITGDDGWGVFVESGALPASVTVRGVCLQVD